MNPADETAKPQAGFPVLEFRRMTALAFKQGEAETLVLEQGSSGDTHRRNQRNLGFG